MTESGKRMKGQISVEFFLVLSIVIAFTIILYNTAVDEVGKTRLVASSVTGKSALDSLANSIDFVALNGNGSQLSREVFVPLETSCFYYNDSLNALYCRISSTYLESNRNRLLSKTLLTSLPTQDRLNMTYCEVVGPGWYTVNASNNGTHVMLNCTAVE